MKVEIIKYSDTVTFIGDVIPAEGSKTASLKLYAHMTEGIPLQITDLPPSLVIAGNSLDDAEHFIREFVSNHPNSELQVRTDISGRLPNSEKRNLPSAQAVSSSQIIEQSQEMLEAVAKRNNICSDDAIIIIQALPEQSIERNTYSFQILRDSCDPEIYHIELRIGSATALARGNQTPDLVYKYNSDTNYSTPRPQISNETIRLQNFKYNLIQYGLKRLSHNGFKQLFGKKLRTELIPLESVISQQDDEFRPIIELYDKIKQETEAMKYRDIQIQQIIEILELDTSTLFGILAQIGVLELLRADSLIDKHNIDRERALFMLCKHKPIIDPRTIPEEVMTEIQALVQAVASLPQPTCLKASICRIPKEEHEEYNPQGLPLRYQRYNHQILIWDLMEIKTAVTELENGFIINGAYYYNIGLPLRDSDGNTTYCRVTNSEGRCYFLHKPSGLLYNEITEIPSSERQAVKIVCGRDGD